MNDNQSQSPVVEEIRHELQYGNGRSTYETRGLTLRELLLEVRQDVKEVREEQVFVKEALAKHQAQITAAPTIRQFLAFMGAYSTILLTLHWVAF